MFVFLGLGGFFSMKNEKFCWKTWSWLTTVTNIILPFALKVRCTTNLKHYKSFLVIISIFFSKKPSSHFLKLNLYKVQSSKCFQKCNIWYNYCSYCFPAYFSFISFECFLWGTPKPPWCAAFGRVFLSEGSHEEENLNLLLFSPEIAPWALMGFDAFEDFQGNPLLMMSWNLLLPSRSISQ